MKGVFATATIGSASAITLSLIAFVFILQDINEVYNNALVEMEEIKVSFLVHLNCYCTWH